MTSAFGGKFAYHDFLLLSNRLVGSVLFACARAVRNATVDTIISPDGAVVDYILDRTMPGHELHPSRVVLGVITERDEDLFNNTHFQTITDTGNRNARFNLGNNLYLSLIHISEPTRPY